VIGVVAALVLQGLTTVAVAQEQAPRETPTQQPPPPSESLVLPPLLVTAPPPVSSSSEQLIPGQTFEVRPQGRPADVLRLIPGLVISQHQGGGKAEQYLLRGFDADHGTDIAVFVDGLPVNMRSHAHGQGYADLHFLIPETVKLVDALKGRTSSNTETSTRAVSSTSSRRISWRTTPWRWPGGASTPSATWR